MSSQIKHLGKFVKEYKGSGEIVFGNGERYRGKFECGQLSTGKIVGSIVLSEHLLFNKLNQLMREVSYNGHKLVGTTDTGQELVMSFSFITSHQSPMTKSDGQIIGFPGREIMVRLKKTKSKYKELRYGVTNFEFIGSKMSVHSNGTYASDRLPVNINSKKIIFEQISAYKNVIKDLKSKGGIDVTSEAITEFKVSNDINTISNIIDDLCLLLSFIRGTYLSWIYWDGYSSKGKVIQTYCRDCYTKPFEGVIPIIDYRYPHDTKYFLEKCYKNYKQNKDKLGLNLAIEFYLESISLIWLEPKYLCAFLALEVLNERNSSIKNITSWRKFKDLRKEIEKTINHLSIYEEEKKALHRKVPEIIRYPLEMRLLKMFKDLSIDISGYDIKRLITLRNKIVHEGTFSEPGLDHYPDYKKLICLLDKTILGLLEYDGYYRDFLNNFKRVKFRK